jgi:hypothetical protein
MEFREKFHIDCPGAKPATRLFPSATSAKLILRVTRSHEMSAWV